LNPDADLLLHNANVLTLDHTKPKAAAVAIKGDRIQQVGDEDDAGLLTGPETNRIDCQGKTVIPGFNDAHCHPLALAATLLSVDCSPASVRTVTELQGHISEKAQHTPEGEWIRATGYNEFHLLEKRHPNRWDLDKAAPDHPVKLSHRSGHACVLNSLALKTLGVGRETPEPPGAIMDRDLETGEPNGLLFEMNSYVESRMPPLAEEDLERGIGLANEVFLSHGITSLQDATWTDSHWRWQTLGRFKQENRLSPRISMMIGADDAAEFTERGLCTGSDLGSGLRLGGVKIVIHTATGRLSPPQEQLNRLALSAHQAGFQLALHAIEENEVEAAVCALEFALSRAPRSDHRHRVEHCSVCPPRLAQRLADLQPVVVTQPSFIYYSGERYLATVPSADLQWLYPIASLLGGGLRVAAGSDCPVVHPSPLVGMYAAVARAAESGQTVLAHEAIPAPKALETYTTDSAYASVEEETKGRIAPNYLADLAVLSDDPTRVPREKLKDIRVLMTVVGGEVVWQQ
jgi:predicted amidohydrolase YtcJ